MFSWWIVCRWQTRTLSVICVFSLALPTPDIHNSFIMCLTVFIEEPKTKCYIAALCFLSNREACKFWCIMRQTWKNHSQISFNTWCFYILRHSILRLYISSLSALTWAERCILGRRDAIWYLTSWLTWTRTILSQSELKFCHDSSAILQSQKLRFSHTLVNCFLHL